MDCTHGTPAGSRYCALCRRAVLAEAGQLRPPRHWPTPPTDHPMPADFRARLEHARRPTTQQPTLEDA